jgi:flagellar biosynthesis/type III secretory pathway ATPase
MNNKSTMISFRVKINSPLFKYLDEYDNTGSTVSEHIRSILDKHIMGDSNANLNHYLAMRRRSLYGKYVGEWCRLNMSEHHKKLLHEYTMEKLAKHYNDD